MLIIHFLNKINLLFQHSLGGFLVVALCLWSGCKKDRVDKTPADIDFSENFIQHSLPGSFWEYTTTQNGDTLTSSPANVFKQAKDSIIDGNPYKVFTLIQKDDTQIPFFTYRFVVNTIFEPRLFDGDSTNILEVPLVDLNRQLNETWEVQTSSTFKQVFSIDSVGLNFEGFNNVFKVKREDYLYGKLTAINAYYYQAKIGLIYRKKIDEGTNAEFIQQLSDSDIDY